MPAPGRRVAAHTTGTLFPTPRTRCTPKSDANAPAPSCIGVTPSCLRANAGGSAAFIQLQFYPPGEAPFADNISCDNAHWCAALTIDSLECTLNSAACNPNCIEPVNFGLHPRCQPAFTVSAMEPQRSIGSGRQPDAAVRQPAHIGGG